MVWSLQATYTESTRCELAACCCAEAEHMSASTLAVEANCLMVSPGTHTPSSTYTFEETLRLPSRPATLLQSLACVIS